MFRRRRFFALAHALLAPWAWCGLELAAARTPGPGPGPGMPRMMMSGRAAADMLDRDGAAA